MNEHILRFRLDGCELDTTDSVLIVEDTNTNVIFKLVLDKGTWKKDITIDNTVAIATNATPFTARVIDAKDTDFGISFDSQPKDTYGDNYSMDISDVSILDFSSEACYITLKDNVDSLTLKLYKASITNGGIKLDGHNVNNTVIELDSCDMNNANGSIDKYVGIGLDFNNGNNNEITNSSVTITDCNIGGSNGIYMGIGFTNKRTISNSSVTVTGCDINGGFGYDNYIGISANYNNGVMSNSSVTVNGCNIDGHSVYIGISISGNGGEIYNTVSSVSDTTAIHEVECEFMNKVDINNITLSLDNIIVIKQQSTNQESSTDGNIADALVPQDQSTDRKSPSSSNLPQYLGTVIFIPLLTKMMILRFRLGGVNLSHDNNMVTVGDRFRIVFIGDNYSIDITNSIVTVTSDNKFTAKVINTEGNDYSIINANDFGISFESQPEDDYEDKYSMDTSNVSILDFSDDDFIGLIQSSNTIGELTIKLYKASITNSGIRIINYDYSDLIYNNIVLALDSCDINYNHYDITISNDKGSIINSKVSLDNCNINTKEDVNIGIGVCTGDGVSGKISNSSISLLYCNINTVRDIAIGIGGVDNGGKITDSSVNLICCNIHGNSNIEIGVGACCGSSNVINGEVTNTGVTVIGCEINTNDEGYIYIGIGIENNKGEVTNSKVTVTDCDMFNYNSTIDIGIGVHVNKGEISNSSITVKDCNIVCDAEEADMGVFIGSGIKDNNSRITNTNITLSGCDINANDGDVYVGIGVEDNNGKITNSNITMENCKTVTDIGTNIGFGIRDNHRKITNSNVTIKDCDIKYYTDSEHEEETTDEDEEETTDEDN